MKEKPKNYANGKQTVREEKVDSELAAIRAKAATETGYYSGQHAWKMVAKSEAEKMTHRDANRILGRMKRLGYSATMESCNAKV